MWVSVQGQSVIVIVEGLVTVVVWEPHTNVIGEGQYVVYVFCVTIVVEIEPGSPSVPLLVVAAVVMISREGPRGSVFELGVSFGVWIGDEEFVRAEEIPRIKV